MRVNELRISQAVRLLVFLALASGLIVLQLDKAAERRASFAPTIVAGFGGFADLQIARRALDSRPEETGRRLEAILRHRPIDSSHLSLFALWAVEQDDPRASTALTSAAKRGWRDRYTQLTVLVSAARAGQIDVAAARLDALARMRFDQEALSIALATLIQDEAGQKAVAERMGASDFLFRRFLLFARNAAEMTPEIVDTFVYAADENPDLDCGRHGGMTTAVLAKGRADFVSKVWPQRCASQDATSLAYEYVSPDDNSRPFAWKVSKQPGLSVRAGQRKGAITVINRDPIRRMFARRFLQLEPGSYKLTVSTPSASATTPGFRTATVSLDAHCVVADTNRRPTLFQSEGNGEITFVVPDDCPIQNLRMLTSRGKAENLLLELESALGENLENS